jgi:hypothetical protein
MQRKSTATNRWNKIIVLRLLMPMLIVLAEGISWTGTRSRACRDEVACSLNNSACSRLLVTMA